MYKRQRLNNAYNTIVSLGWGDASVSGGGDNGSGGGSADTSDFSESYAGTYTVTASSLNVRSTPSTSGAKVGVLPNGAQVTVTSANGSWAAVSYNGISGYCSKMCIRDSCCDAAVVVVSAVVVVVSAGAVVSSVVVVWTAACFR